MRPFESMPDYLAAEDDELSPETQPVPARDTDPDLYPLPRTWEQVQDDMAAAQRAAEARREERRCKGCGVDPEAPNVWERSCFCKRATSDAAAWMLGFTKPLEAGQLGAPLEQVVDVAPGGEVFSALEVAALKEVRAKAAPLSALEAKLVLSKQLARCGSTGAEMAESVRGPSAARKAAARDRARVYRARKAAGG